MIKFQLKQCIERPAGEIFYFLSDLTNMPLWNYYIESVSKATSGPIDIGTIFLQKRHHDVNQYRITDFIPWKKIVIELMPPAPSQQFSFEFEDHNEMTFVVYNWQVDLRKFKAFRYIPDSALKNWLLSFAKRHILKNIRPATEENFNKLKVLLEKRQVTLQDGRLSKL